MSYGNKIKELRKQHNLTQSELADKLFVSRQAVSLWEQDKVAPSKDTLLMLKELFGISIDEWIGENEVANSQEENHSIIKKLFNKKTLLILGLIVCITIIAVGSVDLVSRYNILHPKDFNNNIAITRKGDILLSQGDTNTIVFNENGKPQIICSIPEGFVVNTENAGLYQGKNGTFIRFNSDFEENVFNPLYGTDYYSFYENKGYSSYVSMARKAMYVDLGKVSVFSNKEDIYIAGGSRIIREQLCAGQDADFYRIDGGLTQDGKSILIYGFALHFDDTTWLITLKDYNGCHYYISIKDPEGIGSSADTIGTFLSSIVITEQENTNN